MSVTGEDSRGGVQVERVGTFAWTRLFRGGVPREQKMLKGHLPRVVYRQAY